MGCDSGGHQPTRRTCTAYGKQPLPRATDSRGFRPAFGRLRASSAACGTRRGDRSFTAASPHARTPARPHSGSQTRALHTLAVLLPRDRLDTAHVGLPAMSTRRPATVVAGAGRDLLASSPETGARETLLAWPGLCIHPAPTAGSGARWPGGTREALPSSEGGVVNLGGGDKGPLIARQGGVCRHKQSNEGSETPHLPTVSTLARVIQHTYTSDGTSFCHAQTGNMTGSGCGKPGCCGGNCTCPPGQCTCVCSPHWRLGW